MPGQFTISGDEKKATGKTPPKQDVRPANEVLREKREENINGIGQLLSFGCIVTGQFADAGAVGMHWPNVAREGAVLAESNEYVARAADFLGQVGPFAAILAAAMPLALQVLANHNIIPADKMAGQIVKPEVLESQIKTQLALQAIEALKMQQAAEEELARAQREYQEFANGDKASA